MSEFEHEYNPHEEIERMRQEDDIALWTQEMQGPENRVDPEISNGIQEVVTKLVEDHGFVSDDGNYKRGEFIVRSEVIPNQPEKVPTLHVNIPINNEKYGWLAEINLAMQDAKLSQHVLLNKDATIRVSGYDGRPDTFMSKDESVHFLESLKQIASEITEDLSE